MVYCIELNCHNSQSGICLHCNLGLCTRHIIAHGKALLGDVNDLYQKANELIEQLANASKSIRKACTNAEAECKTWRSTSLERIEKTYDEMMQAILYQKECFNEAEHDIKVKLLRDAIQPLEKMQRQQAGNVQVLNAVRLTLEHVECAIPLLKWPEKSLLPISSTGVKRTNISKMEIIYTSPAVSSFDKAEHRTSTPLHQRSDPNVLTPWQVLMRNAHLRLKLSTSADQVDQNPISTATSQSSTSAEEKVLKAQISAAQTHLDLETNLKNFQPFKKMVKRFADVSRNSNQLLDYYLANCVGLFRQKKSDALIQLVLALLHAWYHNHTPKSYLILKRVSIVKKYIIDDIEKFTVILAVQVFMYHIQNDAHTIIQTIATILELFLEEQLIRKEDLFKWYTKNGSYGLVGFHIAKQCAQPFIENLKASTPTTVQ